jgi:hypothetical protein
MQRTICSIYPQALLANRRYKPVNRRAGYLTTFRLPAAKRGGYELLVVEDMDELFRFSSDAPMTDLRIYADGPNGLASDLINEWGGHVVGEVYGGPGIFLCTEEDVRNEAGEVIKTAEKPSDHELEAARIRQTRWFQFLENQALDYWIQGKKEQIRDQHRQAAEWLGHSSAEWMKPPEQMLMISCPFCGTNMPSGRPVCQNCKQITNRRKFEEVQRAAEAMETSQAELDAKVLAEKPELAGLNKEELVVAAAIADANVKKNLLVKR